MAENDITIAEALDRAEANLRLEGLKSSPFTEECTRKIKAGEMTIEEAIALGKKRYSEMGASGGR